MTSIEPGLIGLFLYAAMLIIILASAYVAHNYTHIFESHLPNCKLITDNKSTYGDAGMPGKMVRCGMMYLFLIFPGLGKKRGLMDIKESRSFPKNMKYLLFIPWTAQIVVLMALIWFTQFVIPRA
ncbi:hypothetical protein ACTAB0_19470 [Pseudomonas syringae]|uniref:hypothetical protein n=1 Tax=Pseudomonas syringae group TaxID=136849 RepID=UPI0006E6A4B3|nr:hypothetical protein [Pseudomonas syringae group genomosp. 3]KPW29090.1 hypothetical protein ALO87_100699 [Pseudomonas syringae pv. apii]